MATRQGKEAASATLVLESLHQVTAAHVSLNATLATDRSWKTVLTWTRRPGLQVLPSAFSVQRQHTTAANQLVSSACHASLTLSLRTECHANALVATH